jgi:CubicO group peptidase (beta-lactamase class C family)
MKHALVFFLFFIPFFGYAQQKNSLSLSTSKKFGISSTGLIRIDSLMFSYVNENKLPGMLTMIAHKGNLISFKEFGSMNVGKPMRSDAIFRIASMTKPVTTVAIMILVDEGLIQLDDPVSKYIPEFKDLQVFSYMDIHGVYSEKQIKQIAIKNLLTHTSGLGSGAEDSYIDSLYKVMKINEGTLKEEIQKLTQIPLKYQPGTRWHYGLSTDVLGYIVEKVSGESLDMFFKERIFQPLKMIDTDYSVPENKLDRVAAVYSMSDNGIQILNIPEINNVSASAYNIRGNGGLLSTATDYMIFSQMLLNKGEYKGTRILKRETVELMTSNQLTDEIMPDDDFIGKIMSGMGFGLGFAIMKDESHPDKLGSLGSFWWSGTANTYFFIDPKEDLILIFMTQFIPSFYYPVFTEFRQIVYNSIVQ